MIYVLLLESATDCLSCTDIFMLFTEQGMSTYFAFLAGEGEEFLMFLSTLWASEQLQGTLKTINL